MAFTQSDPSSSSPNDSGITLGPDGTLYDSSGNPVGSVHDFPGQSAGGLGQVAPQSANQSTVYGPGGIAYTPQPGTTPLNLTTQPQYQGQQPYSGIDIGGKPVYGPAPASNKNNGGGPNIPPPQTIAPFSGVNYPQFTPPPLPANLQQQWQLPTAADLQNMPGYQSGFNQGLRADQRSAAAQGSLLNGGTLEALNRFGQDYATQNYGNLVNQSLQQRNQNVNDYLALAYGPSWQQNQAAVGQYNNLYGQYKDLVTNNQNAQNNYIDQLLQGMNIGVGATTAGAPATVSPTSVGTNL